MPGCPYSGISALITHLIVRFCVSLRIIRGNLFFNYVKQLIVTIYTYPVLCQVEFYRIINFPFVIFHGTVVVQTLIFKQRKVIRTEFNGNFAAPARFTFTS